MPETDSDLRSDALVGQRIVFTGRLASMTHEEASELVRGYGGEVVQKTGRGATLLVVGREGSLLQSDGRITVNLSRARELQREGHSIEILSERDFLRRLGLESREGDIHRFYTMAQLSRILDLPRDRIRLWMRVGLIQPVKVVHRLCYFDFHQVRDAKTLGDLSRSGVSLDRIRESLEKLKSWMPDLDHPIAQLDLLEREGKLLVRLEDGSLLEPSGQMVFDLEGKKDTTVTEGRPRQDAEEPRSAEEWLDKALRDEEAGRLEEAELAYRHALFLGGPQPVLCFNLANVLYNRGERKRALERLYQAVEMDAEYVEAWNNLGNVLGDLARLDEAMESYRMALRVAPDYADAHYNLAETLCSVGRDAEARPHWLAYLKQDPHSPWAEKIRERLRTDT
jgi:tetratricopeptide (TPR) repeat protein